MKIFTICALVILSIAMLADGRLPPTIQVCSRNEKNLADCIIRAVKSFQPTLVTGVSGPGYRVPTIEPFSLDNIFIEKGSEFHVSLTKLIIRGGSNFKIEKLRVNLDELKFDFIISFPKLDITGKYDLLFGLFGTSVKGNGDLLANFVNPKAKVAVRANTYVKNGQTYFQFQKFLIKIQLGPRHIILKNLFKGNPSLEEIGNAFINGNSDFILKDVVPGVENSLANIFTDIANNLITQTTYDEAFPDI